MSFEPRDYLEHIRAEAEYLLAESDELTLELRTVAADELMNVFRVG